MRALWLAVLVAAACGSSAEPARDASVGVDAAAAMDAAAPDSGRSGVECGAVTCTEREYCQVEPQGACTPIDGGACAAPMEACEENGLTGCTPAQARRCVALPAGCTSCPCLVALASCTRPGARCASAGGMGYRVQCPF